MMRFLFAAFILFFACTAHAQVRSFTATQVHPGDARTPGGATFQSHNRLIVRTQNGCYVTYIYKQETATLAVNLRAGLWYSATCEQPWSLLDSFGPYGGGAPAVLADELGDIYWMISDDQGTNLFIRKMACSAGAECLDRTQRIYPGFSSTKWTAMYQEHCHKIFVSSFFPASHTFSIFDQNVNLVDTYQHTINGPISGMEYPWLEESQDIIVAGWVTTPITATTPLYDGIQYMINNSCGARANWYTPNTGVSQAIPFVSDATGPSTGMRAGFTPTTYSIWLDAMILTSRLNLHVSYSSPNGPSPTTQTEFAFHNMGSAYYRVYMHDNLLQGSSTSKVAGATLTIQSLRGSSGCYFKGGDGALYIVGPSKEIDASGKNWINVLKSTDDGITLTDFAQSSGTFNIYALNCMRQGIETSPGVWLNGDQIVGVFTDIVTPGAPYPHQVNSFHLPIN